MSPQIYWTLFIFLVILLAICSAYLVFSIIKDVCSPNVGLSEGNSTKTMMRYNFGTTEVEDLTNFEGNLTSVIPKVSFINKVENTKVKTLLETQVASGSDTKSSNWLEECGDEYDARPNHVIDNLEFCDPESIQLLKSINQIEEQAKQIDQRVKESFGHLSELQYYEINEQYIRLQIMLCDIHCDRKKLRERRNEVSGYIGMCQKQLKSSMLDNFS